MHLKKVFVFGIVCITTIIFSAFHALANNTTVSNKSNEINVTKKANWTEYKGKTTDSNGNPYIKIDFNIDATNYSIPKVTPKPTNFLLCLDFSSSMVQKKAIDKEKSLAINFIKSLDLTKNTNTNVELIILTGTSNGGITIENSTNNESKLINTISNIKAEIQYVNSDKSNASVVVDNKVVFKDSSYNIVKVNDNLTFKTPVGISNYVYPFAFIKSKIKYLSNANQQAIVFISDGETSEKTDDILSQVRAAEGQNDNITFYSIGYVKKAPALELLQKISTDKLDNKTRCFNAYKTSEDTIISSILDDLDFEITSSASLVDIIPKECSVIKDSLTSIENIASTINNNVITWKWDNNKFDSKEYSFSVVTKLDIQQAKNKSQIFTNGPTIDTASQTPSSCTFKYGTISIELNSPILQLSAQNKDSIINNNTTKDETKQTDTDLDVVPETADNFQLYISILGIIISSIFIISIIVYKRKKFIH